jgi:diguanylate cyclase (GGDEF)-like protein
MYYGPRKKEIPALLLPRRDTGGISHEAMADRLAAANQNLDLSHLSPEEIEKLADDILASDNPNKNLVDCLRAVFNDKAKEQQQVQIQKARLQEAQEVSEKFEKEAAKWKLEAANWKLAATTDELTKAPNLRAFMEKLNETVSHYREHSTLTSLEKIALPEYAVVFIDVNKFKNINDTYGHHVGDLALQTLSRALEKITRKNESFARLAGDEFALLLVGPAKDLLLEPNNEPDFSKKTKARLTKELNGLIITNENGEPFLSGGKPVPILCSIGVHHIIDFNQPVENFTKSADHEMYKEKRSGADRRRADVPLPNSDISLE